MKNKVFIVFVFLTAYSCYSQNPWLQGEGEVLLSPSITHYYTDRSSDGDRKESDFSNNGFYENYVYKLYFAAPIIGNKLTFIGNIPFIQSQYSDDFGTAVNNELGDVELGVKMHLKNLGARHYLMAAFTTIIPLYNNDTEPFVGFDRFGTEFKVNISGSFRWMGDENNFHQLELGTKIFYSEGPYQFKLYGSQGYRITKKITVLGEVDMVFSRGSKLEEVNISQQSVQINTQFDIVKTTLSLGYTFTPKFSLYGGVFQDIWNKNVSIGNGWQIFSVINL